MEYCFWNILVMVVLYTKSFIITDRPSYYMDDVRKCNILIYLNATKTTSFVLGAENSEKIKKTQIKPYDCLVRFNFYQINYIFTFSPISWYCNMDQALKATHEELPYLDILEGCHESYITRLDRWNCSNNIVLKGESNLNCVTFIIERGSGLVDFDFEILIKTKKVIKNQMIIATSVLGSISIFVIIVIIIKVCSINICFKRVPTLMGSSDIYDEKPQEITMLTVKTDSELLNESENVYSPTMDALVKHNGNTNKKSKSNTKKKTKSIESNGTKSKTDSSKNDTFSQEIIDEINSLKTTNDNIKKKRSSSYSISGKQIVSPSKSILLRDKT